MRWYVSTRTRLGLALLASSLTSVGLWAFGAITNHSTYHSYLIWNLCLAWLPLIIALWLERVLHGRLWSSWLALFVTLLWLAFLPNSFYVVSDLIHLQEVARADVVADAVMFMSFALNGLFLGYLSLFAVHSQLRKRVGPVTTGALISGVLLLSSFAIYIGRDLRWNTWDIVTNPAGLLFDVSDRLLTAYSHPQVVSTTLGFFALLGVTYIVILYMVRSLRQHESMAHKPHAAK